MSDAVKALADMLAKALEFTDPEKHTDLNADVRAGAVVGILRAAHIAALDALTTPVPFGAPQELAARADERERCAKAVEDTNVVFLRDYHRSEDAIGSLAAAVAAIRALPALAPARDAAPPAPGLHICVERLPDGRYAWGASRDGVVMADGAADAERLAVDAACGTAGALCNDRDGREFAPAEAVVQPVKWFNSPDCDPTWPLELSAVANGRWLDVWRADDGDLFGWQVMDSTSPDGCEIAHGTAPTLDDAKAAALAAARGGK